ncbi:MAG: hypothetical protein EA369_04315 [Bradymonadales bacterium]|nr:MAG: hypothetical protein EA369_04315 [Bradymonadales bacterium]
MDHVSIFLISLSGLFLSGIAAEILFKRTRIPDALWLVGLGILIGPIFNLVSSDFLEKLLPFFAAFALIVILFEGGRQLSLRSLKSTVGRATLLGVLSFGVSGFAAALFSWLGVLIGVLQDWTWLKAGMFGAIVGGSSSIIIIPTMQIGQVKEDVANLVTVESAVTDAFCVVLAFVFLQMVLFSGQADLNSSSDGAVRLLESVGFGVVLGGLAGFFWVFILPWIPSSYSYLITLSALFGFYVLVQELGGSAALAILIFAVIVGNAGIIGRLSKLQGRRLIGDEVGIVHLQLSFVVKVFFFVIVGALLRPPFLPMLFGILLAGVLVGVRPLAVRWGLMKSDFSQDDRKMINICAPRGLAAGVLATLPLTQGVSGVDDLSTIVFAVIVTTIVVFAVFFRKLQVSIPPSPETSVGIENNGA